MLDLIVGVGLLLVTIPFMILGTKLFWLARKNKEALSLTKDYSGINVVHGVSGNQTGLLKEEQRASTESLRNI